MRVAAFSIAILLSAGCVRAAGGPSQSAATIVDGAIAAHGGVQQLAALGRVDLDLRGDRQMIDQSRRGDPPWDREPSQARIVFDGPTRRWMYQSLNSYPGLGPFSSRRVVGIDSAFELDATRAGHGPEVMFLGAEEASMTTRDLARYVPGLLLELAAERRDSLRFVERRGQADDAIDVVSFVNHRGRRLQLLIGAIDRRLRGYTSQRPDPVYGVAIDSVAFEGFRDVGGVVLPATYREYINGSVSREMTYAVSVGRAADSLFTIPSGYFHPTGMGGHDMAGAAGDALQPVGTGIFIDNRSGSLVVDLGDHLVVFDCPNDFSTSQSTIDALTAKIPGKAVRFLVSSHTHPDHCGGARPYFHAGATLIAAQDHVGFYQRLAAARHELSPDPYSATTRPPKIEAVAPGERRVLSGSGHVVELYNVGPSPHSEQTIIGIIDRDILFQVDLFMVPMTGPLVSARPVSDWLAREIERRQLPFKRIIDTHMGQLYSRAQFNEALERGGFRPVRP